MEMIKGGIAVDDRGSLRFINDFNFSGVKRFYQIQNHRAGFIRAWHGHQFEGKYFYVAKGSIMLASAPMDEHSHFTVGDVSRVSKCILSDKNVSIAHIPPKHFNGFKTLEEGTVVLVYSTSTLEESKNDDIRVKWDYWDIWQEDFR